MSTNEPTQTPCGKRRRPKRQSGLQRNFERRLMRCAPRPCTPVNCCWRRARACKIHSSQRWWRQDQARPDLHPYSKQILNTGVGVLQICSTPTQVFGRVWNKAGFLAGGPARRAQDLCLVVCNAYCTEPPPHATHTNQCACMPTMLPMSSAAGSACCSACVCIVKREKSL